MKANEAIEAALKETGKTQDYVAKKIGWTPQKLSGKLTRNTLRADDFLEIMDVLDVDVTLTARATGKQVKPYITGAGRRVSCMVGGLIYDTACADALANDFYADGVHQYNEGKSFELYNDREGRYFFAEYASWEGVRDRITPVTESDAAAFIEKNGTNLHMEKANI